MPTNSGSEYPEYFVLSPYEFLKVCDFVKNRDWEPKEGLTGYEEILKPVLNIGSHKLVLENEGLYPYSMFAYMLNNVRDSHYISIPVQMPYNDANIKKKSGTNQLLYLLENWLHLIFLREIEKLGIQFSGDYSLNDRLDTLNQFIETGYLTLINVECYFRHHRIFNKWSDDLKSQKKRANDPDNNRPVGVLNITNEPDEATQLWSDMIEKRFKIRENGFEYLPSFSIDKFGNVDRSGNKRRNAILVDDIYRFFGELMEYLVYLQLRDRLCESVDAVVITRNLNLNDDSERVGELDVAIFDIVSNALAILELTISSQLSGKLEQIRKVKKFLEEKGTKLFYTGIVSPDDVDSTALEILHSLHAYRLRETISGYYKSKI
jgi:hypothetical protein